VKYLYIYIASGSGDELVASPGLQLTPSMRLHTLSSRVQQMPPVTRTPDNDASIPLQKNMN
jgi:hypothetical protein